MKIMSKKLIISSTLTVSRKIKKEKKTDNSLAENWQHVVKSIRDKD